MSSDVGLATNLGATKRDGRLRYELEFKGEIPPEGTYFWVDSQELLIVLHNGELKAYPSICPHMGAQLKYNQKKNLLSCPWHDLDFNLKSLKGNHPKYRTLCEYRVEREGNILRIYS